MVVGDDLVARRRLQQINYYRLSGYWYPFRVVDGDRRSDRFVPGAHLDDVFALYDFDERLRAAVFAALAPVELAIRAAVGHGLGALDPCAHLRPEVLNPLASAGQAYADWRRRHDGEVARSREDFVVHHRSEYDGRLPVWAAVEVMDWGTLVRLLGFAPRGVQEEMAASSGLRAPQLLSWLRALGIVRNACAHHGRLFNRVFPKRPKLPRPGLRPELEPAVAVMNRTFGQLTLVQYLRVANGIGASDRLRDVLQTFPEVPRVPLAAVGAPTDWRTSALWR